jgi:hypothetical protein
MYIKIENEIPIEYSIERLRYDNPNISFPLTISDEILEKFGIYPCILQDKPLINEKTEKVSYGPFVQDETGKWIKTWNILQKSDDEILSWITVKEMEVRNKRNYLLSETDFYALSDNSLTPEMAAYRQALRDVTSQDGFPENVIWPNKPV